MKKLEKKTTQLNCSMEIDTIKDQSDDSVSQGKNQYDKSNIFMCDFITLIRRLKNKIATFFNEF